MSDVRDQHRDAMRFAERAKTARISGLDEEAIELTRRAFELERAAAQSLLASFDAEPTRSVLFRSAATLALECGELEEARRLAFQGLAGFPPKEIADEIHEIVEEGEFQKHLATRGVKLQPDEFQMSLVGPGVSTGIAPSTAVLSRVESLKNLVFRTGERIAGMEYRSRGRRRQTIERDYEVFLSAPRAGSFTLSVHIGQPEQLSIPGLAKAELVVHELFDCFDLLESKPEEGLRERIGNEAYYANFVSLARRIGPDGDSVRWVGLSSARGAESRHVELKTTPESSTVSDVTTGRVEEATEETKVQGVLRWADATKDAETVLIIDAEGRSHRVRIPPGVDDIVKPHWLDEVVVTGSRDRRGTILLKNIDPVPSR
ncbi:MAG: hypothetical protein OXU75_05145 [Deltaproteobacteria bacterium]|nr:hypothetical protein [Deltaproteobacteria bacterium]